MPPHFALSELVIVVSAAICAKALLLHRQYIAATAIAVLGFAALLGAARFGLQWHEALGTIHPMLTQKGSVLAIILLVAAMIGTIGDTAIHRNLKAFLVPVAIGLTILSIWLPVANMMVLLAGGIILPILALMASHQQLNMRLAHGFTLSLFVFGLVFIRRSPVLGPELSFHLYHIVIAVWLIGVSSAIIYAPPNTPARPLARMLGF